MSSKSMHVSQIGNYNCDLVLV
uniref:Uncharacterized protein n=1 Tax=Rhizophora mucronata TaxID=61149 RepID=A0A2P2Q1Q3_RHIMU